MEKNAAMPSRPTPLSPQRQGVNPEVSLAFTSLGASTEPKSPSESIASTVSCASKGRNKEVKTRRVKTRALYFWSAEDVNKWLKKHGGQYHLLYADLFKEHEINGRTLVRLTDIKLQMMGIHSLQHRDDIMRHIMRLKLKTEAQELKTLDQKAPSVKKR